MTSWTRLAALTAGTLLTLAPLDPSAVRETHQLIDPDAELWQDSEVSDLLAQHAETTERIQAYTRRLDAISWAYDERTRNDFAFLDNANAYRALIEAKLLNLHGMPERQVPQPDPVLSAAVRAALGLRPTPPCPGLGESATRVSVWDVTVLQAVMDQVDGTLTAREIEHPLSTGTTHRVTEITLTTELPGIGTVEVFTDWEPEHTAAELPILRRLALTA